MVEVALARLGLDSTTNSYVVILQERGGKRVLPIWIGRTEAESIVAHIKGGPRERPMTHDLCRSLIVGLGGTLRRVQITKVQKNTYFAELQIQANGQLVQIDARPSDSIAIALRLGAPIHAQESLLTEIDDQDDPSGEDDPEAPTPGFDPLGGDMPQGSREDQEGEQLKSYLENLRPEDFGKFRP